MIKWIPKYESQVPFLLNEIVIFFHRSARPAYVGEVSLFINKNIELTEELIDVLVDRGTLRRACAAEMKAVDAYSDACMYTLVDKPSPKVAFRP
jgi:hypothetical protein